MENQHPSEQPVEGASGPESAQTPPQPDTRQTPPQPGIPPPPIPPKPGSPNWEAVPFSAKELTAALIRPYRAVEVVLGDHERLARNIADRQGLPLLAGILGLASILFAIPYGAVPPIGNAFKIAALYLGSMLICFPSLHVFSQYLGISLTLQQNTVLSLLIPAVAAFFSFGFFPIIWFVHATTASDALIRAEHISPFLLSVALFLAVAHMVRCLRIRRSPAQTLAHGALLSGWMLLLFFITYRMGVLLEIL